MKPHPKIFCNKAQCNYCKEILESRSVHDFKQCSCKKLIVDGGKEYIKRSGFPSDWIELSRYIYDDGLLVDLDGQTVDE